MGKGLEIVGKEMIESAISGLVNFLDDEMKEEIKENAGKFDKAVNKIPTGYAVTLMKSKKTGKIIAYLSKTKDVELKDFEKFNITDMVHETIEGL